MIQDFFAGESVSWQFVFESEVSCGVFSPVDITGYTIEIMFKEDQSEGNDEADIHVIGTITDGPNGLAVIELSSDVTNVEPKRYYYDVRLTDLDGESTYPVSGRVHIKQPSNRRT